MAVFITAKEAAYFIKQGAVIAYPTEAVFGFGCDPQNEQAILRLLSIKQRSSDKGLILVAASEEQILPYIANKKLITSEISASWPGPVTWLLPPNKNNSALLTGSFATQAVRISAHPIIQEICNNFGGPITSTSANNSGEQPFVNAETLFMHFKDKIDAIVDAPLGGQNKPTTIRDSVTGKTIR